MENLKLSALSEAQTNEVQQILESNGVEENTAVGAPRKSQKGDKFYITGIRFSGKPGADFRPASFLTSIGSQIATRNFLQCVNFGLTAKEQTAAMILLRDAKQWFEISDPSFTSMPANGDIPAYVRTEWKVKKIDAPAEEAPATETKGKGK